MDVSTAVDFLFDGVVPERTAELKTLWRNNSERVRLVSSHRFILQQAFGTLQISELALRQIWLTGYAAWKATEAFNLRLAYSSWTNEPLDLNLWRNAPQISAADTDFGRLFDAVADIANAESIDNFDWPANVPFPETGLEISDPGLKATFDLVCMAGAYVFAHEVRHNIFESQDDSPDELIDEERECDRWALALMIEKAADYAISNNWPPETVRAKRLLAIIIAKLLILRLTPRASWEVSDGHPPVRDRLRAVLDAATDPVPFWFWTTVTSMILGFADRSGVDIGRPIVPTDIRDLAYQLCDRLRP